MQQYFCQLLAASFMSSALSDVCINNEDIFYKYFLKPEIVVYG